MENLMRNLPRNKWFLQAEHDIMDVHIGEEKGDEHSCYETHKEKIDELRFLYKWWQERKVKEYNGTKEEMDEDTEMLNRLVKIRLFLWT